jgi:TPR repeat protein
MASREFLKIMKSARSGDALAQQTIGQIYMLGEPGIPKNIPNALLWLEKASLTIGFNEDIFNLVADHLDLSQPLTLAQAQFAWKCLLQAANGGNKGGHASRSGSGSGNTQARWLIAQTMCEHGSTSGVGVGADSAFSFVLNFPSTHAFKELSEKNWQDLGGLDTFKKLAHRYLEELADLASFKEQTTAKKLLAQCLQDGRLDTLDVERSKKITASLAGQSNDLGLTSLLEMGQGQSFTEIFDPSLLPALQLHLPTLLLNKKHSAEHLPIYWAGWQQLQNMEALEVAAELGHVPAQLALGLRLAKLDVTDSDSEDSSNSGNARLKKSVYWLKQAANQGERDAWYALGLINRMPQFSGYSAEESDAYFDKAADLGHPQAQFRKGSSLWRKRAQLNEDIEGLQASYWVWHAAQQGITEAKELLFKIMESHPEPKKNNFYGLASAVTKALNESTHRFSGEMLMMCHRVLVANQLNLSKAELLLVDISSIQHEHGAVIDVRYELPRSTPKLILIETLEQRKVLMLSSRAFTNAQNSNSLDEGNLRQRRYRLEKLSELLGVAAD